MKLNNPEVRIENTNYCNTSCTICPRDKMTRKRVTMDFTTFKYIIDQVVPMGAEVISIFGYGEPLLDKKICRKIEYCKKFGLDTFITTNASLLNTDMAYDLLNAGISRIRVSAHGLYDNYKKVHGLSFSTFQRNISNLIAIRNMHFNDCSIDVSVIPMNGEDIEYIKSYWIDRIDDIEIWRPHNWANGMEYRTIKKRKKSCGRPFNGPIQINSDGTMIVCCFDFNGKLSIGNIHEQKIEEILNGEYIEKIRDSHRTGNIKDLICNNCDQLNIEEESPLLYSTIDRKMEPGRTSTTKFKLKEI